MPTYEDEDGPMEPLTVREMAAMVLTIATLVGAAVGLLAAAILHPDLLANLRF